MKKICISLNLLRLLTILKVTKTICFLLDFKKEYIYSNRQYIYKNNHIKSYFIHHRNNVAGFSLQLFARGILFSLKALFYHWRLQLHKKLSSVSNGL